MVQIANLIQSKVIVLDMTEYFHLYNNSVFLSYILNYLMIAMSFTKCLPN